MQKKYVYDNLYKHSSRHIFFVVGDQNLKIEAHNKGRLGGSAA